MLVAGTLVYGKGDEVQQKEENAALQAEEEAPLSAAGRSAAVPMFAPTAPIRSMPMAMGTPSSFKVRARPGYWAQGSGYWAQGSGIKPSRAGLMPWAPRRLSRCAPVQGSGFSPIQGVRDLTAQIGRDPRSTAWLGEGGSGSRMCTRDPQSYYCVH